ncbi:MAG: hypothetical protein ABSG94_03780 [Brevinematales bacterium]
MRIINFTLPALLIAAAMALFSGCVPKPENVPAAAIEVKGYAGREINPLFFGFNYWDWVDKWGNRVSNTENLVKPLKIALLRAGGINNDAEQPQELSGRFLSQFGDYCRMVGAEPLLQVPMISRVSTAGRIARATNLIRDFILRGYPLRYVSIGNEPDGYIWLEKNNGIKANGVRLDNFKINEYIDNFTNISAAIKREFPGIRIVGPDIGWNYTGWIDPFLASCRPYVDIISVHRYPYWPVEKATYGAAMAEFDNLKSFYSEIRDLSALHGGGLPLIIGEMGPSADGDTSKPSGFAMPGSFGSALWYADNIGVSSSEPMLLSIMPWCISQDWRNGFIRPVTQRLEPEYYTYLLFSNHMKKYLIFMGKTGETGRVYAYRDQEGNVSLFCVNWSRNSSRDITIKFTGILGNAEITYRFEPFSLTCLEISKDLSLKKAYTYTKEMADSGRQFSSADF